MKLILSSCDFGNPKSAAFICDNLCKPLRDCRVLYFPNEKATPEKLKSGKYESRLCAFGFLRKNIHVADYFRSAPDVTPDVDLIYISGGNTFGTLKRIREAGYDRIIQNAVHRGVTYAGGSAGAHIACVDVAHVARYDTDTFGLTDFSGLGFYGGILVCHYTDARREDYEHLRRESPYHVVALADDESIVVRED
ncbi:MAG: Type 1 glutamine amidotransferase-like domain-containing protein [Clostridia bacterium]|nr:Type 1 glutamine amidotransferase-like domain-containing protein [Clostridia bacterium]